MITNSQTIGKIPINIIIFLRQGGWDRKTDPSAKKRLSDLSYFLLASACLMELIIARRRFQLPRGYFFMAMTIVTKKHSALAHTPLFVIAYDTSARIGGHVSIRYLRGFGLKG